jgi:Holliday junction DNA helicase RuvB
VAIQRNEQTPVATTETQEEFVFENTLRPKTLHDFVGQKTIKRNLSVILGASKKRSEPAPHLLFYGPPGLGKTTLAGIIAEEMGGNLKISSGPVIEKSGDLAAILSNLEEGDVLFIDEIHRLRRPVEEDSLLCYGRLCVGYHCGKGSGGSFYASSTSAFYFGGGYYPFGKHFFSSP